MAEEKKELSPFKAKSLQEYFEAVGYELDVQKLNENMKNLTKQTTFGEVDLVTYEGLVQAKIYEYLRFGIARRVYEMMLDQEARRLKKPINQVKISEDDVKLILLEMARAEIDYGLRPLSHTIPVNNQIYIKADGFLFYAKNSGNLKEMQWKDKKESDGSWTSICTVITNDGATYEGIANVVPTGNKMEDPAEKARTKAMRRALRRAFPIGATDEIYDEFEDRPIYSAPAGPQVVDHPADDIQQLLSQTVQQEQSDEQSESVEEKVEQKEQQINEKPKPEMQKKDVKDIKNELFGE